MIDAGVELVFFTGRLARREEVVLVRVLIRRRSVWRWEEFQKITRDGIEALSRNTVTGEGSRAYTAPGVSQADSQNAVSGSYSVMSWPLPFLRSENPLLPRFSGNAALRVQALLVRVLCSAKKKNVRFLPS